VKKQVTTFAGSGFGDRDGPVTDAQFNQPCGICVDYNGVVIVADTANHRIRAIKNQLVSTIAGCRKNGFKDGIGVFAMFNFPFSVVSDNCGNIFVSDSSNHRIRKISKKVVSTIAGGEKGYQDGVTAQFNKPACICFDTKGDLLVADSNNHKIRKINIRNGITSTIVGDDAGFSNGFSPKFQNPTGICIDNRGNIYVSDTENHRIRKINYESDVYLSI